MSKFEIDQEVYDEHGNAYNYIAASQGEHIVREVLEDFEYGGSYSGEVRVLRNVFTSADGGRQKMESQLARLNDQIAAARLELHEVQCAIHSANKEVSERAERLKQHEQLAFLDDYLQGKITHYVEISDYGYGCEIIPVNSTSDIERGDRKFRLLTLSGSEDYRGRIHWQLNRYSDGSGSNKTVYPCRSLEEAQTKARQFLEAAIAEFLAKPEGSRNVTAPLLQCCEKHDVAVPQELVCELKTKAAKEAMRRRDQLQAELAKLDEQIAAAH